VLQIATVHPYFPTAKVERRDESRTTPFRITNFAAPGALPSASCTILVISKTRFTPFEFASGDNKFVYCTSVVSVESHVTGNKDPVGQGLADLPKILVDGGSTVGLATDSATSKDSCPAASLLLLTKLY
jgi:hypothetical protein